MTRWLMYGEVSKLTPTMDKNIKAVNTKTKKEIAGYATDLVQVIEHNAVDAPVSDVNWEATQIQTEGVRIEDPGEGAPVVLRHFFFSAMPWKPGTRKPTKRDLVSENKRLIETNLWADGLRPREDVRIECHTRNGAKKLSKVLHQKMIEHNADFVIQVLCEGAKGQIWSSNNEAPQIAQ